jgi:PAS domain-containing protein
MPKMRGVVLLAQVCARYPETMRILLTGFADMDATIQAINDGHIYAYVNKPWEPADLKQVVSRAIDHHNLVLENSRLVADLRRVNHFLKAAMDRLDVGAIALDAEGCIQAANLPAQTYLKLSESVEGRCLGELLAEQGLDDLAKVVLEVDDEKGGSFEEVDLRVAGGGRRVRVSAQSLTDREGETLGRVIFFKEVSHEPLRRRFEEIVGSLSNRDGELRVAIEEALAGLADLGAELGSTEVTSPHMIELAERLSRSQTALQNWLDVDDALAREDYPDAQLLLDRMRVATQRWPYPSELPARVRALAQQVERYYESGENAKQRVL